MKIFGKSKLNGNIYDKILKGADAIEIHLEDDFLSSDDFWNDDIVHEVPICVVHAPLSQNVKTDIEEKASREILVKTCEFAHKIALTQKHNVIVVCHLSSSVDQLKRLGIYESLVFFIRDLAAMYEHLEFAIENVMRLSDNIQDRVNFKTASFEDPIILAKDINHDRVGTCLDTCHALADISVVNYVTGYLRQTGKFKNDELIFGLDAFFAKNKETIKLIHLSNALSHGMYDDHGLPFTINDQDRLSVMLDLYEKYKYTCPITIEVREKNYSNARNFEITFNNLKRCLEHRKNK
jgi:hypothetical protein